MDLIFFLDIDQVRGDTHGRMKILTHPYFYTSFIGPDGTNVWFDPIRFFVIYTRP